jgi:eukaryotic-like serine/threonine-protein kinase
MSEQNEGGGDQPTTITVQPGRRTAGPQHPSLRVPAAPGPPVPQLLAGRYRLVRVLGAGGTATVWQAWDERLSRQVAVKILHPHLLPDEASRQRLEAEARAAARLAHPAIVRVHDILVDASVAAIVLELVDGEPLSDRLARDGSIPAREAAGIGRDVADALDHAHRAGILHRDVKPANVLLGHDGRARLVDFGIARALDDGRADLTAPGSIMGTLRYMAPEQLAGRGAGPAGDVFALGAVLHEMLTGRYAFTATNPVALIREHQLGPPRLRGVPEDLARIVEGALEPDPVRRPDDAALARALDEWSMGRGVHAQPVPPAVATSRPAQRPRRRGQARRRGPLLVAGTTAAGLLLLGALAAGGGWNEPGPRPPVAVEPTLEPPVVSPTPATEVPPPPAAEAPPPATEVPPPPADGPAAPPTTQEVGAVSEPATAGGNAQASGGGSGKDKDKSAEGQGRGKDKDKDKDKDPGKGKAKGNQGNQGKGNR